MNAADIRFKFPMLITVEAKKSGVYSIVLSRDIAIFDGLVNMAAPAGGVFRISKGVVLLRCGETVLGRVTVRPNNVTRIQSLARERCPLKTGSTLTVEITDAENVYLDLWVIPLPRHGIHS